MPAAPPLSGPGVGFSLSVRRWGPEAFLPKNLEILAILGSGGYLILPPMTGFRSIRADSKTIPDGLQSWEFNEYLAIRAR